jgi:transforming growth factor-beta-induced protein
MQLTILFSLIGLATAQTMTLSQALSAQNSTLSTLNSLLAAQPALLRSLTTNNTQSGLTILAPNNAAFSKVLSTPAGMALAANSGMVAALLEYHVLSGTFPASAFTSTPQFIPTLMSNATFTGVTGGQVVMAVLGLVSPSPFPSKENVLTWWYI